MVVKEFLVFVVLVEGLRGQHGRNHWHAGIELDPHQAADHRLGYEYVAVNPPIHHEARGHDGGVSPAVGEQQCMQWNLERARDFKEIDMVFAEPMLGDFAGERDAAAIDNLLVPTGLDEGDPFGCYGFLFMYRWR